MGKKIKILHVISSLGNGGVESMLKNYYENINKDKIEFDFIVHNKKEHALEKFFLDNNSKIFYVTPKKESLIKNFIEAKNIIKSGNYDVIHCHQSYMSLPMLFLAKKYKIPIRILHVHVMMNFSNKIKSIYKKILIKMDKKLANYYFACSDMAGSTFFGKKWNLNSPNCYLMRNAVEINKFKFNENKREIYRNKYNCEDKIVLLSVGRMEKGKNLDFIVEMDEKNSNKQKYKIIFVGNGTYEEKLKKQVKEINIDNIYFENSCNNVENYYSMADVFLFPSLSEGLGMVAIEAQLNGLPVLASKNISKETDLGNIVYLDYDIDKWNNEIKKVSRKKLSDLKKSNLYDINYESKKYEDLIDRIVR